MTLDSVTDIFRAVIACPELVRHNYALTPADYLLEVHPNVRGLYRITITNPQLRGLWRSTVIADESMGMLVFPTFDLDNDSLFSVILFSNASSRNPLDSGAVLLNACTFSYDTRQLINQTTEMLFASLRDAAIVTSDVNGLSAFGRQAMHCALIAAGFTPLMIDGLRNDDRWGWWLFSVRDIQAIRLAETVSEVCQRVSNLNETFRSQCNRWLQVVSRFFPVSEQLRVRIWRTAAMVSPFDRNQSTRVQVPVRAQVPRGSRIPDATRQGLLTAADQVYSVTNDPGTMAGKIFRSFSKWMFELTHAFPEAHWQALHGANFNSYTIVATYRGQVLARFELSQAEASGVTAENQARDRELSSQILLDVSHGTGGDTEMGSVSMAIDLGTD